MEEFDIIFICHGNVNRSMMAEFLLKNIRPELKIGSFAAGIKSKQGKLITKKTRTILSNNGIIFNANARSKIITKEVLENTKIIFVMDKNNIKHLEIRFGLGIKDMVMILPNLIGEDKIKDPGFTKGLVHFVEVFDKIKECVTLLANELYYDKF